MNRYVTAGLSVLAGAVLLEVALLPAAVIGGAALLAPAVLPRLRRGVRQTSATIADRFTPPASRADEPSAPAKPSVLARLGVSQAIAKTVTFRVIVTSVDFTTNYVVLGEFAIAAGLSTFSLVVGPLFYFMHETAWNYLGPPSGEAVALPALQRDAQSSPAAAPPIVIARPLAKTITFRTIATVMDFTTNFVVIGDAATAAGLTAFGFVLGPFVYLGHEAAWDYFAGPQRVDVLEVSPGQRYMTEILQPA
jgi:uncharacterized membrane protein